MKSKIVMVLAALAMVMVSLFGSAGTADAFNMGDRLLHGMHLKPTDYIISKNGNCRLYFGSNGNLAIQYMPAKGFPIWQTNTGNRSGNLFVNQNDGNLVLYNSNWGVLWANWTQGWGESTLIMQNDCNLVLYKNNARGTPGWPIWSSGTYRDPRGITPCHLLC